MVDRLTGTQVFARVAAMGTLSAAARDLGISPTVATKHVTALEEQLGVKLIHRTTRKVTLTEAGQRFLDSVERILAEVVEAEERAASERVEVSGALRVNVPVPFGILEIAPLMPVEYRKNQRIFFGVEILNPFPFHSRDEAVSETRIEQWA